LRLEGLLQNPLGSRKQNQNREYTMAEAISFGRTDRIKRIASVLEKGLSVTGSSASVGP
jgi:hypothetical protein